MRGRRSTQRGLTVLEIVLATFLLFALTVSFFTLRQKKVIALSSRDCVEKKWSWIRMADEIETKLRRWEISAAPCLKAGFSPIGTDEKTGAFRLLEIEAAAPTVRSMPSPNQLPLPTGLEFAAGQQVIVCSDNVVGSGTVRRVVAGRAQIFVEIAPEGNSITTLFPGGSFVVGVRPVFFDAEEVSGTQKILYERRSVNERKPLGSGFERFRLAGTVEKGRDTVLAALDFESGDCRLRRRFPLSGMGTMPRPGRWWIREGELFFEPWLVIAEEVGR
ncbi:MAG: hypothetical protein V1495_04080 [Pseudomonadota bacterium]